MRINRINMLGGVSHLALFAPPTEEEKKASADKEREKIEVTTPKAEEKEETKEEEIEAKEDKVEEKDDKVEDKEDEIEKVEEKVEELKEKLEEKGLTDKEREKLEARIEKERKKAKEARDEVTRLKAQLEAKSGDDNVLPVEEINKRADEKAHLLVREKEFNDTVARVANGCEKIDKDFSAKLNAMAEDIGSAIPGQMIEILDDLPGNGANVLMHLANNTDEYEEIYQLPPAKMALKLTKIADKLNAKTTKQISKVPEPKDPIGGKGSSPEILKDDMPMKDWVKLRAKQVEERRKEKMH